MPCQSTPIDYLHSMADNHLAAGSSHNTTKSCANRPTAHTSNVPSHHIRTSKLANSVKSPIRNAGTQLIDVIHEVVNEDDNDEVNKHSDNSTSCDTVIHAPPAQTKAANPPITRNPLSPIVSHSNYSARSALSPPVQNKFAQPNRNPLSPVNVKQQMPHHDYRNILSPMSSDRSQQKRSSIFSWTRKRAIRFMSTVGQSIDQFNVSVQSFLSPPPDPSRGATCGVPKCPPSNNSSKSYYSHYANSKPQYCHASNPQSQYYPKGDPFWYHKAYYDSKTKAHQQFSEKTDHFYYVYENGYIKKKWVLFVHLLSRLDLTLANLLICWVHLLIRFAISH